MSVIDGKILLKNNPCFKSNQHMTPKGIVVHSTGADNPYIKRYVQPDDGVIGKNLYGNDWNNPSTEVCVHGFIGKDKLGNVRFYQTLPFDICCWGVGGGANGSYNYDPPYIQFEMCEDSLNDKAYCMNVYNKAVEVCAYLCKRYGFSPDNIVSHREAYEKGYGSGHVDPHNWWDRFGLTMYGFRNAVRAKLSGEKVKTKRDCRLYSRPYKDPVGGTVSYIAAKKGAVVRLAGDDGYGWSKVLCGGKTYYVMNNNLCKKGLSKCPKVRLTRDISAYEPMKKRLGKKHTIKKGKKAAVICTILSGKYEGYSYIKRNGKYYYARIN